MTTAIAQRTPKSNLVVPIILGIVLVPLSQVAVAYLGAPGGTFLGWVVGTPICYFLIGGLGAFTTVSGLVPAQARGRGAWVGFTAAISGACAAGLIVAAIAVWDLVTSPQSASLLHPQVGVAPHVFNAVSSGPWLRFPLIWAIALLLPFFLGVNLLGVGLAPLGGMLGGYLRARVSPHRTVLPEQPGDQVLAHSGKWILVVIIGAVLLAVIVVALLLAINIIALAPHTTGAFPATTG